MDTDKLISQNPEPSQISVGNQSRFGLGTTRRRLLKGAAMTAPVILTLRSGALMAAGSCTGITGQVAPSKDDKCVTVDSSGCPSPTTQARTIISEESPTENVTCDNDGLNCVGNGTYYCSTNNPVVVSSPAYTSLTT